MSKPTAPAPTASVAPASPAPLPVEVLDSRSKKPLDPKYHGVKTYQLTQKHYRDGRMYEAGEFITVENEVPGKSWVPAEEAPAPKVFVPVGRPSDKEI